MNDTGETVFQDALWADPDASHWRISPQDGYRLFDDEGQPSAALTDVLARLRALQPKVARTQALMNLLKLEDRQQLSGDRRVISIARWRTFKANAHLLERFSSYLGQDFNRIKILAQL